MNNFISRVITVSIASIFFFGCFFAGPLYLGFFLLCAFLFLLIVEWWPLCAKIDKKLILLTPMYPILPMLGLLYGLSFYESYMLLPLYPFLMSWAGDTGAYIFGKCFGKHKICPRISPGKSWEGLLGGFVVIVLSNYLLMNYFALRLYINITNILELLLFSAIITVLGFLGDIFVSWLKRRAGVKDTGVLLPGHGGLLDRFDSLFFIVLFVLFYF